MDAEEVAFEIVKLYRTSQPAASTSVAIQQKENKLYEKALDILLDEDED